MSLRDSLDLIKAVNPEGGLAVLEHEILAERASSLGAAEKRVAKAMKSLHESARTAETLAEARDAVWSYFVQRELCGFRRHHDVIREFNIPRDVLNGLGAIPKK